MRCIGNAPAIWHSLPPSTLPARRTPDTTHMTYRTFLSDPPGSLESCSGVGSGTATAASNAARPRASASARQSDAAVAGARMAGTACRRGGPDPLELLDDGQVPVFPDSAAPAGGAI